MARKSAFSRVVLLCSFLVVMISAPSLYAQTDRATGKPTIFKTTVTKAEMWNGSVWVTLFSGSSQLDLVAAGTFPGMAGLSLPAGTYTKLRVTILNSTEAAGSLSYLGTTYYMTSVAGPMSGTAASTTTAASAGPFTFSNPGWGAAGAPFVLPENTISIVVGAGTAYAPTLKIAITNSLVLMETPGFYFRLGEVVVSFI